MLRAGRACGELVEPFICVHLRLLVTSGPAKQLDTVRTAGMIFRFGEGVRPRSCFSGPDLLGKGNGDVSQIIRCRGGSRRGGASRRRRVRRAGKPQALGRQRNENPPTTAATARVQNIPRLSI